MIPFLDLSSQYRSVGPEIEEAVIATLRSGSYVLGESVQRFEERFATFCGTDHAVALSSGTAALHLALLAAGIGLGDEVITVPMTFVATAAAIVYAGATPIFVDIDPLTWTMDPAGLRAAITPRTKAIMPVHLHGRLADMDAICRVAQRHAIFVIEDAAQAHGAERGGVRAGAFGHIGCFSFYPGKNLGACGEGGAVTTNDASFADAIRSLRDWGQQGRYNHVRHGFNYRMDGVQGAALGVKLGRLDGWNARRRQVANAYGAALGDGVGRPAGPFGADHAAHVYAIRVRDREVLRDRLAEVGIATGIHYPRPVHLQPAYAGLGHKRGAFPVSEAFADQTLSLPLYPELTTAQIAQVIETVNRLSSTRSPPHEVTKVYDLREKRILVTGGAGFVGSHIVEALLELGAGPIVVVDNLVRGRLANLAPAIASGRVEFVLGDVRDQRLMRRLVDGVDTVFHQAALRITHCAAEPELAMEVMVDATYSLLRLCVEHKVRKVVFASSASIYGMAEQFPTTEAQHPYDNRTIYGVAKSFGEGLLRSFNDVYGLDYVALRYFNVYGPRMDIHGRYTEVMVRWMERIETGEPPIVFGDGLQTMDMVHVVDVARSNVLAAQCGVSDEVFNVGSGTETSLLELAADLARAMDRPGLLPVHEAARSVNPVPRRLASTAAASEQIGFKAKISRDDGLRGLAAWWRAERASAVGALDKAS